VVALWLGRQDGAGHRDSVSMRSGNTVVQIGSSGAQQRADLSSVEIVERWGGRRTGEKKLGREALTMILWGSSSSFQKFGRSQRLAIVLNSKLLDSVVETLKSLVEKNIISIASVDIYVLHSIKRTRSH
jgi:hypothetical protein